MNFRNQKKLRLMLVVVGSLLVYACSSDNGAGTRLDQPPLRMATFNVTVSNLTNAQPLSPVAVIAHQPGYAVFAVGAPATAGLEELAEGGDNTALLAEADADTQVTVSASGAAPIGPAGSETVTLSLLQGELPGLQLSVSTMLVNTNDAFSGLSGAIVDDMMVGDTRSYYGVAYDAGTEADTESAAEIPGPAGGGEGFNAMRSDQADRVAMHAGVVSQDDGLATSDLTEQHRFDNPVIHIRVERIE